MTSKEVVLAATNVVVEILRRRTHRERNKRKWWVRVSIKRREMLGASNTLLKELFVEDCASCNHLRGTSSQFTFFLRKVGGDIQRKETVLRTPLSARLKLEITLRYLATGDSFS
jgi:hypothetical protein